LKQQNYSKDQIIEELSRQGYSLQQISDAMNQADIKTEVGAPPEQNQDLAMQLMEAPSPEQLGQEQQMQQPIVDTSQYEYGQPQMQQPTPQMPQQPPIRGMEEQIQEVTEAIIDEKWQQLTKNIGDMNLWKEGIQTEVESVKQEILRTEQRIEKLEQTIIGKVTEYQKALTEVNTEMQALGKVFEKILEPLTSNIKELARITKELKEKKK